jgi:hypothetical protein
VSAPAIHTDRTVGAYGSSVPCEICGKRSSCHGDFGIGRRHGETELIEVLIPLCPNCLYGDPDLIDRAERRILFALGLAAVLPSRMSV